MHERDFVLAPARGGVRRTASGRDAFHPILKKDCARTSGTVPRPIRPRSLRTAPAQLCTSNAFNVRKHSPDCDAARHRFDQRDRRDHRQRVPVSRQEVVRHEAARTATSPTRTVRPRPISAIPRDTGGPARKRRVEHVRWPRRPRVQRGRGHAHRRGGEVVVRRKAGGAARGRSGRRFGARLSARTSARG